MNSFSLLLSSLFFSLSLFLGYSNSTTWVNSLPKPWTLNEEQVSEILPQFYQHYPNFHDRLKAFALWQVGKPYEIFKLGEEVEPDPDPIIRLDVSDCTVHVLTSLAFTQSTSWNEARKNMITIHYKDHKPSYKTRWHYTSDRIQENPYTVTITEELLEKDHLEKIDITLSRTEETDEEIEEYINPLTEDDVEKWIFDWYKDVFQRLPPIWLAGDRWYDRRKRKIKEAKEAELKEAELKEEKMKVAEERSYEKDGV